MRSTSNPVPRVTIPEHRRPSALGEILVEDFLKPLHVSIGAFADHIALPRRRLSDIISGKQPITGDTAYRLHRALGPSPEFWLNIQYAGQVFDARHPRGVPSIKRLRARAGRGEVSAA